MLTRGAEKGEGESSERAWWKDRMRERKQRLRDLNEQYDGTVARLSL